MRLKDFLNESHEVKTYSLECIDFDTELYKLLDYIQKTAMTGHSFNVVVDPESSETKKSFYLDGDGSFCIKSLKVS